MCNGLNIIEIYFSHSSSLKYVYVISSRLTSDQGPSPFHLAALHLQHVPSSSLPVSASSLQMEEAHEESHARELVV